ncbi:MAG: S4 domain-containing protein [Atribacterota bacterium]
MEYSILRVDKFFKLSRIIKRRTEAKKACDSNSVKVNDKIAKAGDDIKPQDKIKIFFRHKVLEIEVLEIPIGNVSISDSSRLYRIIKEEKKSID